LWKASQYSTCVFGVLFAVDVRAVSRSCASQFGNAQSCINLATIFQAPDSLRRSDKSNTLKRLASIVAVRA
jgi:hypothetical protein